MGLAHEYLEVAQSPARRVDIDVVGNIISIVTHRRRIKGKQPERSDTQRMQVVELRGETGKITDSISIAVVEGADAQFIENGVLVPQRIRRRIVFRLIVRHEWNSEALFNAQNMRWFDGGIEPHVVAIGPYILCASQQISDSITPARSDTNDLRRYERRTIVRVKWIQIDGNEDDVSFVPRGLGEEQDLIVVGSQKLQIEKLLQCAILATNRVDAPDELLDVSGLVPIANLDFVLLRIEIFFGARHRLVFAQFIPAVDAVGGRQC